MEFSQAHKLVDWGFPGCVVSIQREKSIGPTLIVLLLFASVWTAPVMPVKGKLHPDQARDFQMDLIIWTIVTTCGSPYPQIPYPWLQLSMYWGPLAFIYSYFRSLKSLLAWLEGRGEPYTSHRVPSYLQFQLSTGGGTYLLCTLGHACIIFLFPCTSLANLIAGLLDWALHIWPKKLAVQFRHFGKCVFSTWRLISRGCVKYSTEITCYAAEGSRCKKPHFVCVGAHVHVSVH